MKLWLIVASLGLAGIAVGCEQQGESTSPPVTTTDKTPASDAHDDHEHGEGDHPHDEHGPHGGELVELGRGDYHAELVHNEKTETVTIYFLDRTAKKAVSVDADSLRLNVTGVGKPQQYQFVAVAAPGEPGEGTSQFRSTDEKLCAVLHDEHAKARLTVAIAGKSYTGMIPIADDGHDHHHDDNHDHEEDDHDHKGSAKK